MEKPTGFVKNITDDFWGVVEIEWDFSARPRNGERGTEVKGSNIYK